MNERLVTGGPQLLRPEVGALVEWFGSLMTIKVSSDTTAGSHSVVEVVEPPGAETELLVQVGEVKLVLAVHGRVDAGPDDIVRLAIESENVHLFDRQTGRRMG